MIQKTSTDIVSNNEEMMQKAYQLKASGMINKDIAKALNISVAKSKQLIEQYTTNTLIQLSQSIEQLKKKQKIVQNEDLLEQSLLLDDSDSTELDKYRRIRTEEVQFNLDVKKQLYYKKEDVVSLCESMGIELNNCVAVLRTQYGDACAKILLNTINRIESLIQDKDNAK